ncbi:AB hydrolase-1 domain-containing protein [Durusdinium trenchii]|uniref:AB hydrolase-1 domain-containing protein n=1 Tax=Durusdinium trenchii TaxID=1381693 RepID=A0ABP0SEZ2_9DINO
MSSWPTPKRGQGGILLQTLLRGTALEDASLHVQGAVLSATVPISSLGAGMAMMSHKTNVFKEYGLVAFVYYLFTGRVWDASLVQRLFLLPTTAVEGFDGGKAKYMKRTHDSLGDGWPTTEHPFWLRPSFAHRASLPVLVLGAEEDVIYPPRRVRSARLRAVGMGAEHTQKHGPVPFEASGTLSSGSPGGPPEVQLGLPIG